MKVAAAHRSYNSVAKLRTIVAGVLVALVPIVGLAAPASAESAFSYKTEMNGDATITGCIGTCPSALTIPSSVDGKPVRIIANSAFVNQNLSSVTIPNSVQTIGSGAFYGNDYLKSLTLPNSVTYLGDRAFAFCPLKSVDLGSSLVFIGDGTFYHNSLERLSIPSSVTNLGNRAFFNNSLTAVSFSGEAPSDGGEVFGANPSLEALYVTSGSTSWNSEFSGVSVRFGPAPASSASATPTVVPSESPNAPADVTYVFDTNSDGTVAITGFTGAIPVNLVIPSQIEGKPVTVIGPDAFSSAALDSVTIPDSVTRIEDRAFWANHLSSLDVPSTVTSVGKSAFEYNSLGSLTLGSGLARIGESAFAHNNLVSLTISKSVVNLGNYAFSDNLLRSVTFSGNAPARESIGVFHGNESLTSVNVAFGSTGWYAQYSHLYVRVGEAPFTPTIDGETPFLFTTDASKNVTVTGYSGKVPAELEIPAVLDGHPVTAIGFAAFYGKSLTSVIIPDSVTDIGGYAFSNNSLTSVRIPNSVVTIGAGSFLNNGLISAWVGASVTSVGQYAFFLNSLVSVTFAGNAPAEAENIFYQNPDLIAVDISVGSTGWGSTFSGIPIRNRISVMPANVRSVRQTALSLAVKTQGVIKRTPQKTVKPGSCTAGSSKSRCTSGGHKVKQKKSHKKSRLLH